MSVPVTRQKRLLNGLTLIHLHTTNDPVSACHLLLPGGSSRESTLKAGATSMLWSLLTKGTEKKSARQIAEEIEGIGASIGAGATHDYSEISCHSISEFFMDSVQIMAEVLFRPAFHPAEIDKEKNAMMAAIRSKKESIFTVASEELNRHLYGKHPYAQATSGTEESVASLTPAHLSAWHKQTVIPNKAVLAIASNISFENILPRISDLFGPKSWKKRAHRSAFKLPPTSPFNKSNTVRMLEKFEQAYLLLGFSAPAIDSKDFIPLKLLNACLGGGMSARLFQQLREKEGLAYDVGSFYASKKAGSAFVVYLGLQPARLDEAKQRITKVLDEIITKRIPVKELSEVKNYIKGTYILDHQTNSQRAHYLGWWHALNLGAGFDRTYLSMVDRVTGDDVLRVARKILGGKSISIEIYPKKQVFASTNGS